MREATLMRDAFLRECSSRTPRNRTADWERKSEFQIFSRYSRLDLGASFRCARTLRKLFVYLFVYSEIQRSSIESNAIQESTRSIPSEESFACKSHEGFGHYVGLIVCLILSCKSILCPKFAIFSVPSFWRI